MRKECSKQKPLRYQAYNCNAYRAGYLGGLKTHYKKYIDSKTSYKIKAIIYSNLCLIIIIPGDFFRVASLFGGRHIGVWKRL